MTRSRTGASISSLIAGAFALLVAGACSSTTTNGGPSDAGRDATVTNDAAAIADGGAVDMPDSPVTTTDSGGAEGSDAASAPDAAPYLSTLTNFVVVADAGVQVTRFDTSGNAVDAHDGQIALFNGIYYLYGTSYACGYFLQTATAPFCGFKAYRSTDLVHWTDLGFLFDGTTAT
jgi:hypothetical protein